MASTFTRSCIRISRVVGFTGATPTPQLPMMTVVTPCHVEHALRRQAVAPADRPDEAVLHSEVAHEAGAAGAVDDPRVLDQQVEHGAIFLSLPPARFQRGYCRTVYSPNRSCAERLR